MKLIQNLRRKLKSKYWTPLHIATANSSKDVIEILISAGANINAKDIIYINMIILFVITMI